jgi:PPM family protein phosphatase
MPMPTTNSLSSLNRLAMLKPLPSEIDTFGLTHPGRVRPTNADHFLIASFYRAMRVHSSSIDTSSFSPYSTYSRGFVFLVADGVGAFSQAAEGSAQAVQAVSQAILDMSEVSMTSEPAREGEIAERMRAFVLKAHEALRGEGVAETPGSNATTFTMVMGIWPRNFVIHVGDSRAYRYRRGELKRLTSDQTMAQAMIDSGAMTKEVAEKSPWKHVLISALGSPQLEAQVSVEDIERGDDLLLCSDGLTRHVTDDEIRTRLAAGGTAETICRDLLNQALERGGLDNVTILVARTPAA